MGETKETNDLEKAGCPFCLEKEEGYGCEDCIKTYYFEKRSKEDRLKYVYGKTCELCGEKITTIEACVFSSSEDGSIDHFYHEARRTGFPYLKDGKLYCYNNHQGGDR